MKKLLEKLKSKKKGFTIVELIVVIAIIAVLAVILVPTMTSFLGESKDSAAAANAKAVYNAASAAATQAIIDGKKIDIPASATTLTVTTLTEDITVGDAGYTIGGYMPTSLPSGASISVVFNADGVVSATYSDGTHSATFPS